MYRDKHILTQICGNNFKVLKVAPPLTLNDEHLDEFVGALAQAIEMRQKNKTQARQYSLL